MPRPNKEKNEHEKREEKTAQNLLAREFHYC
jgi:hypothetical protein